ncbi:ylp motif-containing protein 1 [Lasius niger]|uniref:Ylp motif-containing protein 1 n=1 Tax=Lasius niger TaxID=67767 RepID=A0A0J7L384_LASNI|nr:ylp motif-containing protein 1 [Lasius niger]
MQNWNQWQLSAGAVTTPVPQPPVGYAAAAGADPLTLMQSYMQYYNQPTPSGYTPEQWATAQQQGWAQWQQWQQQYQQWQAQYGDKYQETMKHLSAQNMSLTGQVQLPSTMQPPPLPKEDVRPPLPSALPTTNIYQFANMPPPHQNDLPLFPTKEPANKTISQANVTNYPTNPPLPTSQPPLPPEIENRESISVEKCGSNVISESNSAKKLKLEDDELTEAERTFDEQFQQWEEQFNKWKQQNANHPDKTQYKQYEAKWTSWREKLIERREQMRKKREQQRVAAKVEAEKNKNISGDDKILDILSNTENQRLINNLLGIGQTLGLTGKQSTTAPLPPPPPPPPPLPETTNSNNQPATQETQSIPSQVNMIRSNVSSWSNPQQWGNQQYNPRIEASGYGPGTPTMSLISSVPDAGPPQIISPNFTQPPPNLPNNIMPNFSQPPPNFSNNDRPQLQNARVPGPANTKDCPPFSSTDPSNMDMRFIHSNDRSSHSFDGQSNFRRGDQERFGREANINSNLNEQDQFKSTDTFDRIEAQRFRRGDRNYSDFGNNQLNSQNNFNLGNERFATENDRFNRENNRFGPMESDRFLSGGDRFGSNNDRLGSASDRLGNEWLGPEGDRFRTGIDRFGIDKDRRGPVNDRFGTDNERFPPDRFASGAERFVPGLGTDRFSSDRFGPNSEHFRSNDRFSKGNTDYFDSKEVTDHRRDSFGTNPRGFNRNPSFSPPNELSPELKKLMEKRKAAGDVFRPSFIDSDKSSSVGSLSESFKKIAGDSPFRSSFDLQKNLPNRSGSMNFSSSGPSNFQLHSDSGQVSTLSYGPRGHSFKSDNEPSFRGPSNNFAKHPIDYNERLGKDMEVRPHPNQSQPINIQSQVPVKHPENFETTDSHPLLQTVNIADSEDAEIIQVNEADSTNEQKNLITSEGSSKKDDAEESKLLSSDTLLQQDDKEHDNDQTQSSAERIEESSNNNDSNIKKPESLPFMGENDPRPEDLNIEPPPELPNLCLISTNSNQNAPLNPNEDFDKKEPAGNKFDMRFDRNFGFRGMEFKSSAPFELRGPPMFGPKGSHTFPTGPGPSTFQPQGSVDTQLDLRGSSDGPFGPNASSESRVSPGRSNDEQYSERTRNEESSEALNSGLFGSRDAMDEQLGQFGSRALGNGNFGLGRPIDLPFRPRGPIDSPFAPRNPGPFGPRGNEMQFGPRSANDRLDSRTIFERPFGPRGFNDGSCGSRGLSDSFFNTRRLTDPQLGPMGSSPNRFGRMNEAPFDKKPPFDNSGAFGFPSERYGRSNEGPLGLRGSNDIPLGSRDSNDVLLQRNSKNFNENQFESRDPNEGPFGLPDFKARGPVSDSNNANFPSRGDSFHNRGDYMRTNPYNPRREQFEDNISAKKARYESPKSVDEFNRSCPGDENIDIEMRKDKTTEYAGNTSNLQKKELEIPCPGFRLGKFGNDQRPDGAQQNVDSNVPNTFDEKLKSEKITTEPKTADYRPQYGESAASPADFQPKHVSNLFMKRSQLRGGQDFCAQRQFNYNHGEIDKKFVEPLNFTPMKVIDYGHASRLPIADQHLSPVQCFDYGHGDLKPMILEREQQQQHHHHYPKKDFRNWVENEQNLKEYTEKMSSYENSKGYVEKTRNYENYDMRRSTDYNKRKEHDWQSSDKMSEAERKDNDDRKEKGYNPESESRFFEQFQL